MPLAERFAYFDHAAVAPISGPARDAIAAWAEQSASEGAVDWASWGRRLTHLRRSAAAMVSADPSEIALVQNTTDGISLIAEGYPWQDGDNVVVPDDEFPTNFYPWMNLASRGVELRRVPTREGRLDLNLLSDTCDERTRIVAASWVSFRSGWRNDPAALAEVAHRHGALLMLDAIQALGVCPLDVQACGVDFFAADGHKWLLGPEGAGLLYIRREHLDLLRPLRLGWNSVVHDHDFDRLELVLKDTAERYEGGSPNMPGLFGLAASIEMLRGIGIGEICQRIALVTDLLCRRLTEIGATIHSDRTEEHRTGIVSFDLPGQDTGALRRRCRDQDVILGHRGGRLRASPHAYTNAADVERLIAALTAP
jgi:selenocysteine lyase/cysteine desulfurase